MMPPWHEMLWLEMALAVVFVVGLFLSVFYHSPSWLSWFFAVLMIVCLLLAAVDVRR